jgi:hypothetical protein
MRYAASLLAAVAAACLPADMKADPISKTAQSEFAKGDFAACEAHATEAIELRARWWGERGVPDLTKVGESRLSREQAMSYETRAHCRRALKKLPEAVKDIEQASYHYAGACRTLRPAVDFGNMKETCQTAANTAETAAVWKKEAVTIR